MAKTKQQEQYGSGAELPPDERAQYEAIAAAAGAAGNGSGANTVRDPAQRFRELANRRLAKLEQVCRQLCHLGNRRQYVYTDEQRDVIVRVLTDAGQRVVLAFADARTKTGTPVQYV